VNGRELGTVDVDRALDPSHVGALVAPILKGTSRSEVFDTGSALEGLSGARLEPTTSAKLFTEDVTGAQARRLQCCYQPLDDHEGGVASHSDSICECLRKASSLTWS
jgi:hypothetical protein